MKANFRQDDWNIEYDNEGNGSCREWYNITSLTKHIAEVVLDKDNSDECRANAQLIATSPKMYGQLLDVITVLPMVNGYNENTILKQIVEKSKQIIEEANDYKKNS